VPTVISGAVASCFYGNKLKALVYRNIYTISLFGMIRRFFRTSVLRINGWNFRNLIFKITTMNFDELDKVEIALIWLMVAVAVMGFIVVGVKIYDTVWGDSEDSTEKVVVTIEVTDEQYEKFIDIYKDESE
jgi:hypothetical protein